MTTLPIAAGIGIEGIIWVIILIFWGIAQVVQKSRRPSQRPPGQPPRPVSPMENELRDLLEQLSGQPPRTVVEEAEELPAEMEEEEEPPPPVQRRPPPPPARPQRTAASVRAVRPGSPAPYQIFREVEQELPREPSAALLAEIADEMPALKPASVSQVLSMRGMAMHIPVGQTRHGRPIFNPRELRTPHTLRQIVMARLMLDPPKALERPGNNLTGT
jgi:hypothetical protein